MKTRLTGFHPPGAFVYRPTPAPWFLLCYLFAFVLLFEMDWKLGTGWLFWRLGHSAREAWEKKAQNATRDQQLSL